MLKRLIATLGIPLCLAWAAVLMAVLTHWLDGYAVGRAAMWACMGAVLCWVGYMAWTWPGWRKGDDDDA